MIFDFLLTFFTQYGYLGLFLSSILSHIFFIPSYIYVLIPVYTSLKFDSWLIIVVVSIGTIIAEIVDYYIGYYGSHLLYKKEIKYSKWLNNWGPLSIFVINIVPGIPADIISVIVGILRMNFKNFVIGMSLGKIVQTVLFVFGVEVFLKFINFI